MATYAIICGNDIPLLESRAEVLRSAGFTVGIALGIKQLRQMDGFTFAALFVLCHSLSDAEKEEAAEQICADVPDAETITMTRMGQPPVSDFGVGLSASDGPQGLIALSKRLTRD